MLVQQRRRPHAWSAVAFELNGRPNGKRATVRRLHRHYQSKMLCLRILDHRIDPVDGRVGHVVLAKGFDPMGHIALRESTVEFRTQRLVVIDAQQTRLEPGIRRQLRRLQCADQSRPELFQRREVDRDQPLVARPQDISLRQPRAVLGPGSDAKGKIRSKGLHGEVRHRFQHRDFDEPVRPRCTSAPSVPYAA
jgi:hypothetical protein